MRFKVIPARNFFISGYTVVDFNTKLGKDYIIEFEDRKQKREEYLQWLKGGKSMGIPKPKNCDLELRVIDTYPIVTEEQTAELLALHLNGIYEAVLGTL